MSAPPPGGPADPAPAPRRSVLQPRELMNLAGALTVARFPLALLVPVVKHDRAALFAVIVVAGVTDLLDGVVARRTGTVSRSGALIDGLLDKIFLVNVAWSMELAGYVTGWHVLAWCVREVIQGMMLPFLGGRYILGEAPWPTHAWQGKIASGAVGVAMFSGLGCFALPLEVATWIAGIFGAWAGGRYLLRDRPWSREAPPEGWR